MKCILFLCRQNCSDKMDAFLSRTFHVNGGYDNNKGMSKLNLLMEQIEVVILKHWLIEKKFFLSLHFKFSICSQRSLINDSKIFDVLQRHSKANRIFYLSVPQDALLDVACSLSSKAQTKKGWNRVIIEKPFGFDMMSSHLLTKSLLSQFEEKQIYRCLFIICSSISLTLHLIPKTSTS